MSPETPPSLELQWPSGADYLAGLEAHPDGGRFVVPPGTTLPAPGALVSATLRFADKGVEYHVHARVLDERRLAFLPEERTREDLVRAGASGDTTQYQRRRHVRIACRLPVRVETGRLSYETTATNISDWGVHLALDVALDRESLVFLSIDFPDDRLRLFAQGRVRSVIPAGPQRGVSVEFVFDTSKARDAMAEKVRALASAPAPPGLP